MERLHGPCVANGVGSSLRVRLTSRAATADTRLQPLQPWSLRGLTVPAGSQVKDHRVGVDAGGKLVLAGTAAHPVRFTSVCDETRSRRTRIRARCFITKAHRKLIRTRIADRRRTSRGGELLAELTKWYSLGYVSQPDKLPTAVAAA
jgi:hypothetical protein